MPSRGSWGRARKIPSVTGTRRPYWLLTPLRLLRGLQNRHAARQGHPFAAGRRDARDLEQVGRAFRPQALEQLLGKHEPNVVAAAAERGRAEPGRAERRLQ